MNKAWGGCSLRDIAMNLQQSTNVIKIQFSTSLNTITRASFINVK